MPDSELIYWRSPRTHQWFSALKTGKCDYKECGSLCCRFFLIENITAHTPNDQIDRRCYYWSVTKRARIAKLDGYLYALGEHNCGQLEDDGTCRVYKERPNECKQWPTMRDNMHELIKDKCTIKITGVHQVPKYKVPKEYKDGKR